MSWILAIPLALGLAAVGGVAPSPANAQGARQRIDALEVRVAALEALLAQVTLEDGGTTVRFTGVNLQIVDGSGDTAGATNSLGNFIVGYNGDAIGSPNDRSGSHNLIVGDEHTYSSFGGFVAGSGNTISGQQASVTGGQTNSASGPNSSICGGIANRAIGRNSSVSGGRLNVATAESSSISGGLQNRASGNFSAIGGGFENDTTGQNPSVSGGPRNHASAEHSWTGGGAFNEASGVSSSVSGGFDNEANGMWSSVSGGKRNLADGSTSSVSGGEQRTAPDEFNWAAGNLFEPN